MIEITCYTDDEIKAVLTWLDDLNNAHDEASTGRMYDFCLVRPGKDPTSLIDDPCPTLREDDESVTLFLNPFVDREFREPDTSVVVGILHNKMRIVNDEDDF